MIFVLRKSDSVSDKIVSVQARFFFKVNFAFLRQHSLKNNKNVDLQQPTENLQNGVLRWYDVYWFLIIVIILSFLPFNRLCWG